MTCEASTCGRPHICRFCPLETHTNRWRVDADPLRDGGGGAGGALGHFPPPLQKGGEGEGLQTEVTRRFYIIAGEASGDRLGGGLMRALRAQGPADFAGIGGRDMMAAGLDPLFDMDELSVMGLTEVLPRLPALLRRIRQTARDVAMRRPDALISIDSPDFSLRVARRARRHLPDLPVIHYVAPSVWAWRPGRAARMARHVDHVLALLPFEPPHMHAAGMSCDFVGHPAAARPRPPDAEIAAFRQAHGLAGRPVLLLAPGSRRGVIRRMMPIYLDTLARLRAEDPALAIVCPVAEAVAREVGAALATLPPPVHAVPPDAPEADRRLALAAADAALCTSGTVTLEVAAAGVPTVVAYRASPLTAAIVRRLARVDTVTLVNLVIGRKAVPEFLQESCTATKSRRRAAPAVDRPKGSCRTAVGFRRGDGRAWTRRPAAGGTGRSLGCRFPRAPWSRGRAIGWAVRAPAMAPAIRAVRRRHSPAAARRHRAGAAGRSWRARPRSSPSTARSSRPCG